MFLPIGTDAPIYHHPYVTIGIIAANIVVFVITGGGEMAEGWLLTFGQGLHPSEWIRSAFLHFGLAHLAGNMLFLFIFGLIIEGKLGAVRFLLLYLVLCLFDGMAGQVLMLNYTGPSEGAGGASGVVFAMMAIAWLWAPKNCVEFMMIFWYHAIGSFEVTLQTVALYYIGTNLLFAWLLGFEVSTPVLHLIGAGVGFGVGLLMLKQEWVDCEGWDLLSLRGADHPMPNPTEPISRHDPPPDRLRPENRLQQVQYFIAENQAEKAWPLYAAIRNSARPQRLPQEELARLLKGVVRIGNWNAAVALLEEYLERFDEDTIRHQLALASILTRQLHRPRAALKILHAMPTEELEPRFHQRYQQIRQEALQQFEEGILEIRESN